MFSRSQNINLIYDRVSHERFLLNKLTKIMYIYFRNSLITLWDNDLIVILFYRLANGI